MLSVRQLKRLSLGPIDLEIAAGDIAALTGPSGAGKSLLLRAIADLDPNDGELTLHNQARAGMDAPDWRRRVMYVPAHAGWWADIVETHFEGLSRNAVKDTLHQVGLESTALGWQVQNLSTGERQRLALVRAVAHKPDVLLLDEPTSGLDPDNVARAEKLVTACAAAGLGIVFVTHDLSQAQRLGTRRLNLADGQLTEVSA